MRQGQALLARLGNDDGEAVLRELGHEEGGSRAVVLHDEDAAAASVSCRRVDRRSGGGKLEPEGRPLTLDAVEANPPAVGLVDLAAEGEPETRAADLPRVRRIDPEELGEEPRLLDRGNSEPRIADGDTDAAVLPLCRHLNRAARRRILDRVREQVRNHLRHTVALADDLEGLAGGGQTDLVGVALSGERLDLLFERLRQVERLEREREAPFLDPLEVEEVVDQARQPSRLAVDRLEVAAARLRVELPMDEQLGEAEDACERRAQLMRDSREKLGLHALGLPLGGDLPQRRDPSEQLAPCVAGRRREDLEAATRLRELELVDALVLGIVGDERRVRAELVRPCEQGGRDLDAFRASGLLRHAPNAPNEAIVGGVGQDRSASKIRQLDAVDGRIEDGLRSALRDLAKS